MLVKAYASYTIIDVVDGMQWQEDAASHPSNPKEGWAYYNTKDKCSYIYDGIQWVVFSYDGTDGSDGSGLKKINTHTRNFTLQKWQTYGEVGHEENWTTGTDYDNSHIKVGDTAYLIGTVSDVIGAGGKPAEAMLYGTVLQVVTNHVRMSSSHVITGGEKGDDGTSVTVSSIKYQAGTSAITAPTGTWSSSVVSAAEGQYLWTKTTYSDGSIAYTVSKQGMSGKTPVKGIDYFDGTPGTNGKDGTSIVWKGEFDTPPSSPQNGWAYYDKARGASYVYQNGWYQMSVDGVAGVGISSTTVTYGVSTSVSTKPTTWSSNMPTSIAEGAYLWTRTVTDYTDASVADTTTYTCSRQGADGYTPVKGTDYNDGTSVTVSSIKYQAGDSATTAPTGTWSNSVVTVAEGKYLWTKTTFSDGNVAYGVAKQGNSGQNGLSIVWKGELSDQPSNGQENWVYKDKEDGIVYICKGSGLWEPMVLDGSDGKNGTNGTNGLSVFITYNDSATTPSTPTGDGTTGGWHTNATSSVIWMSQKVAASASEGTWGAPIKTKGERGTNGTNGTNGDSITDEITQYYQYESCKTPPASDATDWMDTFPSEWDSANPYIWKRIKQTWNQGGSVTTKYTTPQLMSQVEVATIMAQMAEMDLADWCVENNITIIDGSEIATGSITADKIDIHDLSALQATIGGWNIYDNAIVGNSVALLNEGSYYASLVNNQLSAIKISAGGNIIKETFAMEVDTEEYGFIDNATVCEFSNGEEIIHFDLIACYNSDEEIIDASDLELHISYYYINGVIRSCIEAYRDPNPGKYRSDPDSIFVELLVGYRQTSPKFKVLDDGSLYASAANIEGKISSNEGDIGGWSITQNGITKNTLSLLSDDNAQYDSLVMSDDTSPVRMGVMSTVAKGTAWHHFYTDNNGMMRDAPIVITPTEGQPVSARILDVSNQGGDWNIDHQLEITINSQTIEIAGKIPNYKNDSIEILIEYTYIASDDPTFMILEDGSLYAKAANIEGVIKATDGEFNGSVYAKEGEIGSLKISGGGLSSTGYGLNEAGLVLTGSSPKIQVGDLTLKYDDTEKATLISTSGHFILRGQNDTQLEFMKDTVGTTAESYVSIYFQKGSGYVNAKKYADVWVTSSVAPLYDVTFDVDWQAIQYKVIGGNKVVDSGTVSITLASGSTVSEKVQIIYSSYADQGVQFHNYNDTNYYWSDLVENTSEPTSPVTTVGYFSQIKSANNLYVTGNILPSTTSTSNKTGYNLGGNGSVWNAVYARTTTIQTSDRNKKNTIQPLSEAYEQVFDSLKPVSYKFNVSNNNRTHTGLIAQDVKESIENAGLTTQDFAGYCEWTDEDGNIGCGLRYSEFIALAIDQTQKLKQRVTELEERIALLEQCINKENK